MAPSWWRQCYHRRRTRTIITESSSRPAAITAAASAQRSTAAPLPAHLHLRPSSPLLRLFRSPLNNRRSVFAVLRTERRRRRLRSPSTSKTRPRFGRPPPPSLFAYCPSRSSLPSDRLPLVASSAPLPETTSPLGLRKRRPTTCCCRRAPSSSSGSDGGAGGDDKKEETTMRESSPESPAGAPRPTPQRRWRPVATPLSTLSSESSRRTSSPIAAISRCTADDDHRMTSCSQPAPSNPSSSATFSPYSDESSSSRRREQRIPDPSPTSASHSTSYHLRTIFANLRWSLLLAVLVFLLLASCECSARPQDDDLDSQAYSEYRVDPPTDLSRNQTAFFQLASRTSFNMLQGERVVEPPLDSQERRKEKWLERHKHRKNKNDRRGRKRLKGEQKESFILTRNELPKMKDNCVGVKITQRVRMAGCLTRVVHNRYCHGTCTSVFIPRLRAKKLKATFESCSACLPYDYDRVQIRLECPDRDPPTIVRRVIKVKSCTCQSQCQLSNV